MGQHDFGKSEGNLRHCIGLTANLVQKNRLKTAAFSITSNDGPGNSFEKDARNAHLPETHQAPFDGPTRNRSVMPNVTRKWFDHTTNAAKLQDGCLALRKMLACRLSS